MESNDVSIAYRVLVVDDEEVVALTLAHVFNYKGYEARAAYSAEQGLELLNHRPPHLALVDVCLPRMNGIECCRILKQDSLIGRDIARIPWSPLFHHGRTTFLAFAIAFGFGGVGNLFDAPAADTCQDDRIHFDPRVFSILGCDL